VLLELGQAAAAAAAEPSVPLRGGGARTGPCPPNCTWSLTSLSRAGEARAVNRLSALEACQEDPEPMSPATPQLRFHPQQGPPLWLAAQAAAALEALAEPTPPCPSLTLSGL